MALINAYRSFDNKEVICNNNNNWSRKVREMLTTSENVKKQVHHEHRRLARYSDVGHICS